MSNQTASDVMGLMPGPNMKEAPGTPREEFILFSRDVPLISQWFYFESDAQRVAEEIARHHRGSEIAIAKVIATVREPLPALEWSDGRPGGLGRGENQIPQGLVSGMGTDYQKTQKYR